MNILSLNNSVSNKTFAYFRSRPWIIVWLGIFTAIIILLAVTHQIHIQGNGRPAPLELSVPIIAVVVFLIFKFIFHIDLSEEYLLGILFGCQWEFLTEPYWTYLPGKFNVLIWSTKDIPLLGLAGWGTNLALALLLSEFIGTRVWKLSFSKLVFDWRVLITDAISIQLLGASAEWLYGIYFGGWKYNIDFGLGKSPLHLGWEVHIGYMIVFFWYGTTMRIWRLKLEGKL